MPSMLRSSFVFALFMSVAVTGCGDSDASSDTGGGGGSAETSGTSATGDSSSSGSAPITATTSEGTFGGQPLNLVDAATDPVTAPNSVGRIYLQQDHELSTCALIENNLMVMDSYELYIDAPGGVFKVGMLNGPDVVLLTHRDATCSFPTESYTPSAGTVEIVSADGNGTTGKYTLTFSGETISGTFVAPTCPQGASTWHCSDGKAP